MKIKMLLVAVSIFLMSNISAQDNVKYQEVNGHTFKFTYYEDQTIQTKEEVYPLEKEESGSMYRSLDYFEEYNTEGVMTFKGNKVNGRQLEYYNDGTKKSQGQIMNSKIEGRKTYYNTSGDLTKVEIYKNGELADTIIK